MFDHPEEGASVTGKLAIVVRLDISHDLSGLSSIGIGPGSRAVGYAEPKHHLLGLTWEQIISQTIVHADSGRSSCVTVQGTVENRPSRSVVELRHQEIQIRILGFQNSIVLRRRHQIRIHRGMSHFVSISQCVQLLSEHGGHTGQEVLGLGVAVQTGIALSTSSALGTVYIVAIFVVNINSIETLALDDVDKGTGECFLSSKAVVPAVV
mmetsp:Transcript_11804/g.25647  ORF Transcript_11804/g.25647 Transcript_11804/m.25647 type:complete len:209 (-) Transcript_11804:609-1235(-)